MSAINRRRFIQLAGGTAAVSALSTSALSTSIARAAEIPANRRTSSLRDVDHIVVLMQENRSFDHYFGTLRGVRGFGDPRPVLLPNGKPVWYQSDGAKDVLPFRPEASPVTHLLRPGAQLTHVAHVESTHGWYDLRVASDRDGTFLARLAGNVETGRPSTTDPATA